MLTDKEKEFYLLLLGWTPSIYVIDGWRDPNTQFIYNLSTAYWISGGGIFEESPSFLQSGDTQNDQ